MRTSAASAAIFLLFAGCDAPPRSSGHTVDARVSAAALPSSPAMVDGAPLAAAALWPALAEAAGAVALRELAMDRAIETELLRRGLSIGATECEAERRLLLESLSSDGDAALRLLEELRRRDGLGPARFASLLRRNAALRALVQGQVQITDESMRVAHDLTAGPRRQVRIAAVSSLAEAEQLAAQVRAGAVFADLAVERSIDASAARGGLLEPFARSDPSYPESVRAAAFALGPGQLSAPVLLGQGYVVCTLVREIPATGQSLEALRPQLERGVRLAQERLLMDQLGRRLLGDARVTVFDEHLNWSWEADAQRGIGGRR